MSRKVGVVFVGLGGCIGNTVALGCKLVGEHLRSGRGLLTAHPDFDALDLVALGDIVFGGWDMSPADGYAAGTVHRSLKKKDVEAVRGFAAGLSPWPAITGPFDATPRVGDTNISASQHPAEQFDEVKKSIHQFRRENNLDHIVLGFVCSPLLPVDFTEVHLEEGALRDGIEAGSAEITSLMIYALAAVDCGCSIFDFTANQTFEMPAIVKAAEDGGVPFAGSDGRSGQTILKSTLAEMLRKRDIKVDGWYSTNILGNNDGAVLSYPDRNTLKMAGKKQVLAPVLGYDDFAHAVDITYYPPRGDNKEFWDNVDIVGFLDMPMTFKINWMGRDSILAAPPILDLIRLLELADRVDRHGLQSQLDIFFKHPLGSAPHNGWNTEYEWFLRQHREMA